MKNQKSFYSGMLTSLGLMVTLIVLWLGFQMTTIMPMVKANPSSQNYVAPSPQKIAKAATALERMYHLSKFMGLNTYASKAIGSAGKVLSLKKDRASKLQAKYYFLKSIEEAEMVALAKKGFLSSEDEHMDPLFDAYLKYSSFLDASGNRHLAKRTLHKAQKIADRTQSKSDRVKSIKQAIHKMNIKRI